MTQFDKPRAPNQDEVIQQMLAKVRAEIFVHRQALERASHVLVLNNVLLGLKDMANKFEVLSRGQGVSKAVILHPNVSGEADAIFVLTQRVFEILDDGIRTSDPFQVISGIKIAEIDAIDLSAANLPWIVPRALSGGSKVTVTLSQIDAYRRDEFKKVAQLITGDEPAIRSLKGLIEDMGGYANYNIF